jgi:Flp pilus assembly protein TadG
MSGCSRLSRSSFAKWYRLPFGDRRGVAALEFAILAVPFFLLVLGVCEVSFDLFLQEATDLALQAGARQMAIGASSSSTGESNFVKTFVCNTTAGRMLICNNFHVKVQLLASGQDYSTCTGCTGQLPMNGNNLDLSSYDGSGTSSVFCTAPPGTLILISAIYVGPTFLSGLLPTRFNEYYNGTPVHAVLSQVGVASEEFPPGTSATGAAPQC